MSVLKFRSIRTRLLFWVLFVIIVSISIEIPIIYYRQKETLRQESFNRLQAIRDIKALHLSQWIDRGISNITTVSFENDLVSLENLSFKDQKLNNKIRGVLERYLTHYTCYNEFFIINPKTGIIEISTNPASEGLHRFDEEYFTVPMETRKLHIKDIYYSKMLSKPTMTFSIPIFCTTHPHRKITGILVARIDVNNSLYPVLEKNSGLGKTGETFIINRDGIALSRLRWNKSVPFNVRMKTLSAIKSTHGETGIREIISYYGEETLEAYTYIPQVKWRLVTKQSQAELNAPMRKVIKDILIFSVVLILIIIALVLWVAQQTLRPLYRINSIARKIKDGDYTARNKVISEDEFASLAEIMNKMAASIESMTTIQSGIFHLSETIINQSSLHDFAHALLKQLLKITSAQMGTFYLLNEENSEFEYFVSSGTDKNLLQSFSSITPSTEFRSAILRKKISHIKETITLPIIIDDIVVALVSIVSATIFKKEHVDIITSSSTFINNTYASLLGNERTFILSEHLALSNDRLSIQSEELQKQTERLQSQSKILVAKNKTLEMQHIKIEQANRLKTEFLANMSHELRTPLNAILILSQILLMQTKGKLAKDEKEYLSIIERNGQTLLSLINEILDLSKIEIGKEDVSPHFISLHSVIQMVKNNMDVLANKKEIYLNLSIPDNLPLVNTDETKLHQVLMNIVGNAVKFTEEGGLHISVEYDEEELYIIIKDSGIGISKEILPEIFDEFVQGDGSLSRQYEGTGLGLAIAKKTMKILGGRIKVKSILGEGSTFTVIIPFIWHKDNDLDEISEPTVLS